MFTHHAYLIEGGENAAEKLRAAIEEWFGMSLSGNPDFLYLAYESFGVDESRVLKETASRRPIGERKAILLRTDTFTREAQNALLKLFEDPAPSTHFFIVTPYPRALLPTLLSRMEVFTLETEDENKESEEMTLAKKAMKSGVGERMQIAGVLHEEENKGRAIRFLEALSSLLSDEIRKKNNSAEIKHAFSAVSSAASYARDRGASLKTLLEYAVLSLPEK